MKHPAVVHGVAKGTATSRPFVFTCSNFTPEFDRRLDSWRQKNTCARSETELIAFMNYLHGKKGSVAMRQIHLNACIYYSVHWTPIYC